MRAVADVAVGIRRAVRGFTLIELLVTLTIMGILATAAVPMAALTRKRVNEHELHCALIQIRSALDAYKHAADQGIIAKSTSESGYPKSLGSLVSGVEDLKAGHGRQVVFLRRLPRDPFYPDAAVRPEATWGLRSYASSADAPQAGADVFDVYSKSQAVGLNGVPYREW